MKQILFFIVGVFVQSFVYSQNNLVFNGGFELGTYNGGTDPTYYYSGSTNNNQGQHRFDNDLTYNGEETWTVANPSGLFSTADSPDWIPSTVQDGDGFCGTHSSFYVRSASRLESLVTKLNNNYHLIKGQTYRFTIKVRAARGYAEGEGSFQLTFSTEEGGLNVSPANEWVAGDFYIPQSCDWRYIEFYFLVPDNNDNNYEDMEYLVLQYNHEVNGPGDDASLILHYDDVYLTEVPSVCQEIKYIQDWQYFDEHRIVQANQEIRAGAHVSPITWGIPENPVIVKSSAKVIYRAPTVYLEPGFFIEEPGSYFETQDGTCVADPCPPIPPFTGPAGTLCGPVVLGTGLPETLPGVFYSWEPSQYFSDPWSKVTTFAPPANQQSGCINAKLVIWTICGAAQTYNFPVKYFNQAANVTLTNFQDSPTSTSVTANITNASSYTVTLLDQNGQIINEETVVLSCPTFNVVRNISFQNCDYNMCGNKIIKVVAHNDCFPDDMESVVHIGGTGNLPVINVSNLVNNDFTCSFNVAVNSNTEFVTIELLDAITLAPIGCSKTYNYCVNAPISSLTWDSDECTDPGACPSHCKNYKIRITYKNQCNGGLATQIIDWIKTNPGSNNIIVPNYPNVITPNGDGINDQLCFDVSGADAYSVVIVNQWGSTTYSGSSCIHSNPVCVWDGSGGYDGVYYYTINFWNYCGGADVENTTFVQIFGKPNPNGMIVNNNPQEDNPLGDLLIEIPNNTEDPLLSNQTAYNPSSLSDEQMEVRIFPNPVEDRLYIRSNGVVKTVIIRDINGKIVLQKDAASFVDCSSLAQGVYIIEIETNNTVVLEKFVKK